MNKLILFSILLVVVIMSASALFAAAPLPTVGPKMLMDGGDVLNDEILAFQRLRAERRTVLENDDSSPIVCKDNTGRIYLVSGSGKLLISNFEGEAFSYPTEIVVARRTVTDVQALGVLKSGKLVIAYRNNGKLCIARSENCGITWLAGGELKVPGYGRVKADGVRIVQLANGNVLLPLVGLNADGSGEAECLVFASKDEGKTWSKLGSLGPRCASANIIQLKSGGLLAAITYRGERMKGDPNAEIKREGLFNNVVVARSADGGKTWGGYQCVTRYKETPGDLIELSDGTVVLTYGQQNRPCGARAVVSKDGGRTWGSHVYLLGNSTVWGEWYSGMMFTTGAGWRVSTVAMKGDTILTLYTRGSYVITKEMWVWPTILKWYSDNGTPGEKGKAIISVRWTLDGMKKPPMSVPSVMKMIGKPNEEGYVDNGRHLFKPEHLNEGGDYFHQDEILAYDRVPCKRQIIATGAGSVVALDPDGNPVVSCFKGLIYRSKDNGRTWEQFSKVPEGYGIYNFGILKDGTMLVFAGVEAGKVYILRSEDGGKTWSDPIYIPNVNPGAMTGSYIAENARIAQLPDGTVLLNTYFVHKVAGEEYSYVCRSRDGGKTWGDFSLICRGGSEMNFLPLKSGRLLAAVRDQSKYATDDFVVMDKNPANSYRVDFIKSMDVVASDDSGYTWSRPKTVTRHNEAPGDLVEMPDGTIVMSYFQKNCQSGARAIVSRDGAKTWDSTLYMLGRLGWMARSREEGCWSFTSSVILKDGNILTVSTGWSQKVKGSVLEATIWKPVGVK